MDNDQLIPLTEKDSQYDPPEEEVVGYAEYLGFVLPEDEELLYLAKEGLKADLPPGWTACTNKAGEILYKNLTSGEVMEDHPLDQVYRERFQREKKRLLILRAQKERIFEENESDNNPSDTFGLLRTSESQFGKSSSMSPIIRQDPTERLKSESLQSVKSVHEEEEIDDIPVGLNFGVNISKTLRPETQEMEQLNNLFSERITRTIKQEMSSINPNPMRDRQSAFESAKTEKLSRDIQGLGNEIREKQRRLQQLTRERMSKERELVQMEEQFQSEKQQMLQVYRRKVREKLKQERQSKEMELQSTFKSIVKKHSREIQKTIKHPKS